MPKGPQAESITGGATPEPPLEPEHIAGKLREETRHKPIKDKIKKVAKELDREVSGVYEAKQDEASRDS